MRITDLRHVATGDHARVSARVQWEDMERSPLEIYYEAAVPFAEDLACSPEAFLVAAVIPAMRHGERRVAIDGEICPELRDGLEVAMRWLHAWHGAARRPVAIEGRIRTAPPPRAAHDRGACFFTGGVDSMATLRWNRLRYRTHHPGWIRDGIIIHGLEVDDRSAFDAVLRSLAVVAADAQMTLVPVSTNVRELDLDWHFWEFEWEGAVYASVAHALSRRLTSASISATYDIPNMNRLGSHPLLDGNYGSSSLRVRHEGLTLSRLDKIRLISQWEAGLARLRVCNKAHAYRPGTINCGDCEKCVRTMLGLAATGALGRTRAFGDTPLSAELVLRRATIYSPYMGACYRELPEPLDAHGHHDLADAVRQVIARAAGEVGWRGSMRRLDRSLLGGRLLMIKRVLILGASAASGM
jgi:hypothetical protein